MMAGSPHVSIRSPAGAAGMSYSIRQENRMRRPGRFPGPRGVPSGMMLPAGFEPASEARKAPILDRTRLRERKAGLVPNPINAFGNKSHWNCETGNFLDATTFGGRECAAR